MKPRLVVGCQVGGPTEIRARDHRAKNARGHMTPNPIPWKGARLFDVSLKRLADLTSYGPARLVIDAHDQQLVRMPLIVDSEWRHAPAPNGGTRAKA